MRLDLDASADECRRIAGPIRDKWRKLRPEWRTTDSPLKYVDWALEETIEKSANLCKVLGGARRRVVEIGPGACFLAYMLKEMDNDVIGYDLPDRPLYRETAGALGITVVDYTITPHNFPEPDADMIVATQISWLNDWPPYMGIEMIDTWLRECISPDGLIVLFPNPQAFGGLDPALVWECFRPAELRERHLGRGFIFTR